MTIDPYSAWLASFSELINQTLPAYEGHEDTSAEIPVAAPCCVILAPHPDDECISGALPLRLRREAHWRIVAVAVTLGSDVRRKVERAREFSRACAVLGFEAVIPEGGGLTQVNPEILGNDNRIWQMNLSSLASIIKTYSPKLVLMPHAADSSLTHQGVHLLGTRAIEKTLRSTKVAFTEYWSTIPYPNLLVETSIEDTSTLLKALSCHVGEMKRARYLNLLPGLMADNVRRGAEHIMGLGSCTPAACFATLYSLQVWENAVWRQANQKLMWLSGEEFPSAGFLG